MRCSGSRPSTPKAPVGCKKESSRRGVVALSDLIDDHDETIDQAGFAERGRQQGGARGRRRELARERVALGQRGERLAGRRLGLARGGRHLRLLR